jgi:uracil-DNA glycosylase family 4
MFTGDGSARFLMAALHRFGYANQPTSESVDDGLVLTDAYMTAIVRCAPPHNKPSRGEIRNCGRYWTEELRLLRNLKVVLALGRLAFDAYVRFLRSQGVDTSNVRFQHASVNTFTDSFPALCGSYHPSRQNTQTGRLTVEMFNRVFSQIRPLLAA